MGKSWEEAKVTARSDFLLIYAVILIFGNTPWAHSRLKIIQQTYILLKSKILSKNEELCEIGQVLQQLHLGGETGNSSDDAKTSHSYIFGMKPLDLALEKNPNFLKSR